MKRAILILLAAGVLTVLGGCLHHEAATCNSQGHGAASAESCPRSDACPRCGKSPCGRPDCPRCGGHFAHDPNTGLTGVVTYPYYTLRGPRDFLQRNPQPIGP
jgi:hypothetical protein